MKKVIFQILVAIFWCFLFPTISNAENLFKEGTEWFCKVESCDTYPPKISSIKFYLQGLVNKNDKSYLSVKTERIGADESQDYNPWGAIRAEGENVYYLPQDCNEEVLIYGFDLIPDEIYKFSPVEGARYEIGKYPEPIQIELVEEELKTSEYGKYELMKLQETHSYGQSERPTYWIKGIGSIAGPMNNLYADLLGGSTSLIEVKVDGVTVYKDKTAGVSECTNNYKDSTEKAYNLDGTPHEEGEKGIYIVAGKKVIER
ncbi:MAG: hypothetical protein K2M87_06700 [Muribaculaceae bacterium]|nr:hypothetical protein [Muribaculaceae bacterium]